MILKLCVPSSTCIIWRQREYHYNLDIPSVKNLRRKTSTCRECSSSLPARVPFSYRLRIFSPKAKNTDLEK